MACLGFIYYYGFFLILKNLLHVWKAFFIKGSRLPDRQPSAADKGGGGIPSTPPRLNTALQDRRGQPKFEVSWARSLDDVHSRFARPLLLTLVYLYCYFT